ncbi:hypothetical protein OAD22_08120 [Pseudomonadales bacterium]|nr:hypothetical protein [Pseudomonadales bacterium]MDB9868964.1 hypothetical protein [Pseudomonadales bacterium]MDB9917717.1 hypothetical protein [Pseudomonadales bacterium]MDB9943219.1 hypothetical protein [Pseudomonadales bacterium]MDC1368394.1 hypothetical protein [Pseudomonadales bacterium]
MVIFRILLVAILMSISAYTVVVISDHGLGLFEVFFSDIRAMAWPGQFNVDFMSMLALSGLWLAWRHHFSAVGVVVGVLGFFGGAPFLCVYLLLASFNAKGDMHEILLGKTRTHQ